MGAGRKSKTILVLEKQPRSPLPGNSSASARNLPKSQLAGAIFGCKHSTMDECLEKQLFGLPAPHFSFVKKIKPGLPLFLFNYSDRRLHGIYKAASPGQLYIDSYAWTENGKERTAFPAQIRINIMTQCQPLMEKQYSKIIEANYYYGEQYFYFELDRAQTKGLMALFESSTIPSQTIKSPVPSRKTNMLPASKIWKETTNLKHASSGSSKQKWYSKPSVHPENANKYAALGSDNEDIEDGSSSKKSTSDPEDGEIGEPNSGWGNSGWGNSGWGEDVQGSHSDFCTHPDVESETWHGCPSKMPTIAHEDTMFKEPVSELENWEEIVEGSNSGVSPHPNGEISLSKASSSACNDFCTHPDVESQTWHGCPSKMPTIAHEDTMFKEPVSELENWEEIVEGSNSGVSPHPNGEISLSKASSSACNEGEFNGPTSDLEADWLEKNVQGSHSGVSSDWDEENQTLLEQQSGAEDIQAVLQKLQKLSTEREHSVLSSKHSMHDRDMPRDVHEGSRLSMEPPLAEENTTPPNLSIDVHEETRLQNESFVVVEKPELVHIIKELKETNAALKKQMNPNAREPKNMGCHLTHFEDQDPTYHDTTASGARARASTRLLLDSDDDNSDIEGGSQEPQLDLGEGSQSKTPCSDRQKRRADTTTSKFSESVRKRTEAERTGAKGTVGVRADPYSIHHATKLLNVIPDLPIELFVKTGERIIADPGFREFFISVEPEKRRQLLDHMV